MTTRKKAAVAAAGPILMGAENPDGWKLEELLDQLRREVRGKSAKIEADTRPEARAVLENNRSIIRLLAQAAAHQRSSMQLLEALSPNQGPKGKPRIGVGSEGA